MVKGEEKALNDIQEYGCHILHVLEDEDGPRFSYSIGIEQTSDQPEIIITGLKQELAHHMINDYNNRIKDGENFQVNQFYQGFLDDFDVMFKKVEEKFYDQYFGWAKWLYKGKNFNVLQLVYPSTSGVWPWDENASDDYKWFVPKLYTDD